MSDICHRCYSNTVTCIDRAGQFVYTCSTCQLTGPVRPDQTQALAAFRSRRGSRTYTTSKECPSCGGHVWQTARSAGQFQIRCVSCGRKPSVWFRIPALT